MEAGISFKRRHFQNTIILSAVRWYLSYSLSYRDIEELTLKRGVSVDHSTINRWVVHYSPVLEAKFRAKFKQGTGASWRMDETYIKIKGEWHYLYRAVDAGCRAPRKTFWDIPVNQNVLGGATSIFDAADVLLEKSFAILSK